MEKENDTNPEENKNSIFGSNIADNKTPLFGGDNKTNPLFGNSRIFGAKRHWQKPWNQNFRTIYFHKLHLRSCLINKNNISPVFL